MFEAVEATVLGYEQTRKPRLREVRTFAPRHTAGVQQLQATHRLCLLHSPQGAWHTDSTPEGAIHGEMPERPVRINDSSKHVLPVADLHR